MKITMYELLGMVKDGKAPKEIIFENYRYHKHPEGYFRSVINSNWIALTTDFSICTILNDEVEIIEEEKKIPEKFKINYEIDEEDTINLIPATMLECDLACRINEIIDYLKSKGDE